jgi:hypothetical protein
MAFAMPEGMNPDVFLKHVEGIRDWFAPLSPFGDPGSILEM